MAPHYHPGNHLHQICLDQSGTEKKKPYFQHPSHQPKQIFSAQRKLGKKHVSVAKVDIDCDDNGARLLLLLPIG
jgi:hypothetical protein